MKKIFDTALVLSIFFLGYFTHRIWVFSGKVQKSFEYSYSAIECLIQITAHTESQLDLVVEGNKLLYKQKYAEAMPYYPNLPECAKFFEEQRCWVLNKKNPKSLDNCGKSFGYTSAEIEILKKAPSQMDAISKAKDLLSEDQQKKEKK